MRLVLLSFPGGSYQGSGELRDRWYAGQAREVSEAAAGDLLAAFPEHFALVAEAPIPGSSIEGEAPSGGASDVTPEAPHADRMVRKGKRRGVA